MSDADGRVEEPAPACPWGASCRQTGLLHFADFAHQIAPSPGDSGSCEDVQTEATSSGSSPVAAASAGASGQLKRQDTVPIEEFLAAKRRRTDAGGDVDADEAAEGMKEEENVAKPLSRGLSLLRQFSAMTHAERKALVADAIAARLSLERRLRQAESRERRLSDRLCAGLPTLPEEREALREDRHLLVALTPDRLFRPNSPQEVHYRIAEAQFHRLLARDCVGCFQVTKVEYVVNPKLLRQFRQFQSDLASEAEAPVNENGSPACYSEPVLAFHGTEDASIESICATGFRAPATDADYAPASDTGWYGRGIYFSEFPACAMDYVKGRSRLLLCMVLPGRSYRCPGLHHGQPLKPGFHSHRSPDGRELVAFSAAQALPTYIVHYERCLATVNKATEAADCGPHDGLHSLYFRATGRQTRLLDGVAVRLDPSGLGASGLLLTADQVTRFCLAQGASKVTLLGVDEGQVAPAGCRLVVVGLRAGSDCPDGEFWTLDELLQKCLAAETETCSG